MKDFVPRLLSPQIPRDRPSNDFYGYYICDVLALLT